MYEWREYPDPTLKIEKLEGGTTLERNADLAGGEPTPREFVQADQSL
jgi:hypothetical protein